MVGLRGLLIVPSPFVIRQLKRKPFAPLPGRKVWPSVVPPECGNALTRDSPRSMPLTVATGSPSPWRGARDGCGASSQGAARRAMWSEGSQSVAFVPWRPCLVALVLIDALHDKYSDFADACQRSRGQAIGGLRISIRYTGYPVREAPRRTLVGAGTLVAVVRHTGCSVRGAPRAKALG